MKCGKLDEVLPDKKGQAALEFFVTYGWVILILLTTLAALSYIGVFKFSSVLPDHCIIPMGITCMDYKVTSNNIQVTLKNSLGYDLSAITIAATGCGNSNTLNSLEDGDQSTFIINCNSALAGSKYTGQLNVSYTKPDTGLSHTSLGRITTNIE